MGFFRSRSLAAAAAATSGYAMLAGYEVLLPFWVKMQCPVAGGRRARNCSALEQSGPAFQAGTYDTEVKAVPVDLFRL